MAVSARNQLTGTVSAVAMGAVNDEVELTLAGGAKLVAIVTHSSQQALGLAKGKEAIALIKAPWGHAGNGRLWTEILCSQPVCWQRVDNHRRRSERHCPYQNGCGF